MRFGLGLSIFHFYANVTLHQAFESFINLNPKAPEYISLFIDENLKKGLKGVSLVRFTDSKGQLTLSSAIENGRRSGHCFGQDNHCLPLRYG